jgi:hypothetical protein
MFATDLTLQGDTATVEARNGKAVLLWVPPAGFVVYGGPPGPARR